MSVYARSSIATRMPIKRRRSSIAWSSIMGDAGPYSGRMIVVLKVMEIMRQAGRILEIS